MLKHMKIGPRLVVSIGLLTFVMLLTVSLFSIYQIRIQSGLTEKLYRHPLVVSNAVRDVEIDISKMQCAMKDVALADDTGSLEAAVHEVDRYEKEVYAYFDLIEERFLGNKRDVEILKELFIQWKPIRDNVIDLIRKGRHAEAALLTNSKGREHVKQLGVSMQRLTNFAQTKADEFLADARRETQKMILFTGVLGLALFLVVMFVVRAIARSLARPLTSAVFIADRVSRGDTEVLFRYTSKDEIGQLLEATQRMVNYIKEAADVTEKISRKDLQVEVHPKSEKDTLNHSLQRMSGNLRQMMQELQQTLRVTEEQGWLKEGANQLNSELSGELSLKEVCRKATSYTARYIGAGHGVLYVYDLEREILQLQGTFAFNEEDLQRKEFHLGEGIIGQVAQEREAIFLNNIPRREQRISTAIVSEAPLCSYTIPLLYDNNLYGVLELAGSQELTESRKAFVETATRVIATSIFSAIQREQVQKLLQISEQTAQEAVQSKIEAQEQARKAKEANQLLEEQQQQLQQQNEEFQQLNAQLEEQRQELEQQREELRQQQAAKSIQ